MGKVVLTEKERRVVMDTIDALKWEGWTRVTLGASGLPSCLAGAFSKAQTDGQVAGRYTEIQGEFGLWLRSRIPYGTVTYWNDFEAKSLEHVLWTLAEFAGLDPASVLPDEDDLEVMP